MQDAIRFALSNFTLIFLILGLVASGITLLRAPTPLTPLIVTEALRRSKAATGCCGPRTAYSEPMRV